MMASFSSLFKSPKYFIEKPGRAKNIQNKPRINEDPKDAMIREFHDEITRLREELAKNIAEAIEDAALENVNVDRKGAVEITHRAMELSAKIATIVCKYK